MADRLRLRFIRRDELPALLDLYNHLHASDDPRPSPDELDRLWETIHADPRLLYFGGEVDGRLVASCTLSIIPNLTRGCRPYGLVENVVCHPDYRRRGIGKRLLRYTLAYAWDQGCYKVMLLTGRQDPGTLQFYEEAGFLAGVKTGFIAYPA